MNNIIKKLAFVIIAVIGLASCQNEDATYSGPEFVMFADSSFLMPVLNNDTVFEVTVVSSTTSSVDRNFSVDIVNSGTTAIRGYHYDFVDKSNNITIKAGENKTSVKIKSYYENLNFNDSIVLRMELVAPKDQHIAEYSKETVIDFVKCPPFNINEFLYEGNYVRMIASFPLGNQNSVYHRSAVIKGDDQIIIKNMINEGYDIKAYFDDSDPVRPRMKVPEQIFFKDYSYGDVYARSVNSYSSYFIAHGRIIVLYLEVFVPQIGSFGVYPYIIESITEDQFINSENGIS